MTFKSTKGRDVGKEIETWQSNRNVLGVNAGSSTDDGGGGDSDFGILLKPTLSPATGDIDGTWNLSWTSFADCIPNGQTAIFKYAQLEVSSNSNFNTSSLEIITESTTNTYAFDCSGFAQGTTLYAKVKYFSTIGNKTSNIVTGTQTASFTFGSTYAIATTNTNIDLSSFSSVTAVHYLTIESGSVGNNSGAIGTNDQAASGGARGGNGAGTNAIKYGSDLVPFTPGVDGKPTQLPIGGVGSPPVSMNNGGGGNATSGGGGSGGTTGNGSGGATVQAASPGGNRGTITYDSNALNYFGDLISDFTGGSGGTAAGLTNYGTQSRYAFGGHGGGGGGGIVINWDSNPPITVPGSVSASNGARGGNCNGNRDGCGEGSGGLEGAAGGGGEGYGSGGGGAGGNAAICNCSETSKIGGNGYPKTWIVRVDYAIKTSLLVSGFNVDTLHQSTFDAYTIDGMYPAYDKPEYAQHHSPTYEYQVAIDQNDRYWYLPVGTDLYLDVAPTVPSPNRLLT